MAVIKLQIDAGECNTLESMKDQFFPAFGSPMPLYEYECKKCHHRFERIQKFSDPHVKKCPDCRGPVEQVISAPAVQFKGSGTINGSGDYGFMLTAIDGQVSGGGGTDKFRIKIWKTDGTVVYDNQMNAATDAVATQSVTTGTGSVMVLK